MCNAVWHVRARSLYPCVGDVSPCIILSVDTGFLRTTFFCSQPGFLAALIYEGFLPMANRIAGARKYCVLPKVCACVSV